MPFLRLTDGSEIWTRPVRPGDKAGLDGHHHRLSLETVHRRYLAAKPTLSRAELRYLTEVDGVDHIAIVAVDTATGDLVGVARCVRLADAPDTAEWAIDVADRLQGQGLGRHLLTQLADAAREVGIRRFSATMLADNRAAAHLLELVAPRLERSEISAGVRTVVATLAA